MTTHLSNLEFVREACIKANPAIMELGFGCEIRFKLYQELFVYVRKIKNGYHQVIKKWGDRITEVPDLNEVIVLGRPIRLADVLFAYQYLSGGITMGVNQAGHFMFSDSCIPALGRYSFVMAEHDMIGLRDASPNSQWNLLKDYLHEQSPETLAFLRSLLDSK